MSHEKAKSTALFFAVLGVVGGISWVIIAIQRII